jgi:aryl-alcohol dehydrogenase-like predicted oxidoreductase
MRYVEAAGVRVSAIGLGTWQFGTTDWGYGPDYAARIAPALVRRALELGVTLIDTAEVYGNGASELIVRRGLRDAARDAFVATKLNPLLPIPALVVRQAAASRARLGVRSIDLYQIHWPNPLVPVAIQAAGLRRVLDAGIASHVGVSNHSLERWQAMERSLGRPVISNQVELSLGRSRAVATLVPWAAANDRLVIAYSPLGQGLLTGHHRPTPNFARRLRRVLGSPGVREVAAVRAALADIAGAHGATMAQVALAWVIGLPNVVAIPGARTLEQLEMNVAAADLELTAEDRQRLSNAAAALSR